MSTCWDLWTGGGHQEAKHAVPAVQHSARHSGGQHNAGGAISPRMAVPERVAGGRRNEQLEVQVEGRPRNAIPLIAVCSTCTSLLLLTVPETTNNCNIVHCERYFLVIGE